MAQGRVPSATHLLLDIDICLHSGYINASGNGTQSM